MINIAKMVQLRSGKELKDNVLKGWDHWLIVNPESTIKKPLQPNEYLLSCGKIIEPYWYNERLRNEAASLQYIKERTTIPVPEARLYEENGGLCLELSRLPGVKMVDVMAHAGPEKCELIIKSVNEQLESWILPEMHKFKRHFIGSVDESIPTFPPFRIYQKDRRDWPRIHHPEADFVFCHNGLSEYSIYIAKDSWTIVGIDEWACAGFFPHYFERPFWTDFSESIPENRYEEALAKELAFFSLKENDLQDDGAKPEPPRRIVTQEKKKQQSRRK